LVANVFACFSAKSPDISVSYVSLSRNGGLCVLLKSIIATWPPLSSIARQISRPIPLAPPVTTQTFPSSENDSSVRLCRTLLGWSFPVSRRLCSAEEFRGAASVSIALCLELSKESLTELMSRFSLIHEVTLAGSSVVTEGLILKDFCFGKQMKGYRDD
jgi:hypothetical protein